MSYGLSVQNASGDVVIDDAYRNHAIVERGTVSVPRLGASYPYFSQVRVVLATPIAMSRGPLIWGVGASASLGVALVGTEVNGSAELIAFTLCTDLSFGGGTLSCDWVVTALPTSASSETHGLRVWDSSSNLVFDSGLTYLKIRDVSSVLTLSVNAPDYEFLTFTHAAMSTRLFCLSALYALATVMGTDDYNNYALGVRKSSNTQSYMYWVMYAYIAGESSPVGTVQNTGPRQIVIAQE